MVPNEISGVRRWLYYGSEKRRGSLGNEEATGKIASRLVRRRHPDAALPPHIFASVAGILKALFTSDFQNGASWQAKTKIIRL